MSYLQNRNRLTDLENKLTVARGNDEGTVGGLGIDMYARLYLGQITSKDLLYSTRTSAQCHVAAWMGGESGGKWTHVYV